MTDTLQASLAEKQEGNAPSSPPWFGHPSSSTHVKVITGIPEYAETMERTPFVPSDEVERQLKSPGTARANVAASATHPNGTEIKNYASRTQHRTVMQQHCDFFDPDGDGVIWPGDTYRGFRDIGFNVFWSLVALFIIHANFSYPTVPGFLPDPFFRLFLNNIHKTKHGSDTGTFDNEGRFVPQKFEDFFAKYGTDEGMTAWQIWNGLKGQRVIMDPIGWGGALFEWLATYLFLWPADGIIRQDDVRRIYDGSIFYDAAEKRGKRRSVPPMRHKKDN